MALALPYCTPGVRGGPKTALPLEPSWLLLGDRAWSWLLVSPRPSPSPDPEQDWRAQLGPSEAQWAPASNPLPPFPGPEQPQPVRHWRCADWPVLFCYPRSCQRLGQRHHDTGESGSVTAPLGFCSLTCLENRGCNVTLRALGWTETAWVPRMSWDTESPSPFLSPGGAQHSHLTSSEMVLLGRGGVWLGTMACRERMTHQLCSEAWVVMAVVLAVSVVRWFSGEGNF